MNYSTIDGTWLVLILFGIAAGFFALRTSGARGLWQRYVAPQAPPTFTTPNDQEQQPQEFLVWWKRPRVILTGAALALVLIITFLMLAPDPVLWGIYLIIGGVACYGAWVSKGSKKAAWVTTAVVTTMIIVVVLGKELFEKIVTKSRVTLNEAVGGAHEPIKEWGWLADHWWYALIPVGAVMVYLLIKKADSASVGKVLILVTTVVVIIGGVAWLKSSGVIKISNSSASARTSSLSSEGEETAPVGAVNFPEEQGVSITVTLGKKPRLAWMPKDTCIQTSNQTAHLRRVRKISSDYLEYWSATGGMVHVVLTRKEIGTCE